jgi:hypothetical protein
MRLLALLWLRVRVASSLVLARGRCVALAVEAAVSDVTMASGCVVKDPGGADLGEANLERTDLERVAPETDPHLRGLRQLLVALGNALENRLQDDLEGAFEQHVRQLLGLRTVRLREVRARYQARLVTPTRTTDSIVLGVPGSDPRVQAVLEASCDPGRRFDERDLELLTAVAHLGGLIMEIARRQAPARIRPLAGIAPLIGSTAVMRALRERVDRVAATDFTVLVEGESGRMSETPWTRRTVPQSVLTRPHARTSDDPVRAPGEEQSECRAA